MGQRGEVVTGSAVVSPAAGIAAERARRRRSTATVFTILVLVATAIGNLATFRAQEGELADPHRAWVSNDSDRLLHLTREHGRNVGSRFTLYVWLGDQLPGSTVVVAPGHPLVEEGLVGLGRVDVVAGVHEGRIDTDVAAELADMAVERDWFSRGRFARNSSEVRFGVDPVFRSGDYAIVLQGVADERSVPETGVRLVTYWTDDLVLLVDERVASDHDLPAGR
jgi:hypothetical protein